MYHVLIGQNEMFLIDRRFKFHVVIIYKEKMKINTLQNVRQSRCAKADVPKLCSAEHQVLREASPSAPQRD